MCAILARSTNGTVSRFDDGVALAPTSTKPHGSIAVRILFNDATPLPVRPSLINRGVGQVLWVPSTVLMQRANSSTSTSPANNNPNAQRIEVIRQYYQQLSSNYKAIVHHLQLPDLPPARRHALTLQKDKLEKSLQEFNERVLKPLQNASAAQAHAQQQQRQQSQMTASGPAMQSPLQHTGFAMTPQGGIGPSNTYMFLTPGFGGRPGGSGTIGTPLQGANVQMSSTARQALASAQQQHQIIQQQQWAFQQRLQARTASSMPSPHPASHSPSRKPFRRSNSLETSPAKLAPPHKKSVPRTVQEFASSVDKRLVMAKEAENAMLMMADEFLETVINAACQNAVNRSVTNEANRRDFEVALLKHYPFAVPGVVPVVPLARKHKKPVGAASSAHQHQIRLTQLRKHLASLNQTL